ncbi:hypothetical protein SNA_39340 [Streptomyces natalensis ATCC 27448]|uniref:Uncharacterized protein n=1 Tax=Streptomyces natalensis ATCC 27448 TaxID=1240678 RepID=A0A0D7CB47_9ACTN|nr:hypothetical protein [Streptomyces natalensis]KIZ13499.1 hypothetical protein SNA_39340 [Streptomyces natalensis ATCC 27448]
MVRNVSGSLIALIGATAAVWSPFRPWYDGRHGSSFRIEDLFNGISDNRASLYGSLFLPLAFAGLMTLAGVALRSRLLVALAGIVVLGFTVVWMVRQGQAAGELTAGARGLGVGVPNALGGGALMLLGALVMSGRGSRVAGRGAGPRYGQGYDDGYGRDDERAAPPPPPPTAAEPWDPGRPVTHDPAHQEWTPEQHADDQYGGDRYTQDRYAHDQYGYESEPPDEGPDTRPLPRPGYGGGRPPHEPSTEPWPRPTPPPPPPPPTRTTQRRPPTPPVEWGREQRRPDAQRPPEEGQ